MPNILMSQQHQTNKTYIQNKIHSYDAPISERLLQECQTLYSKLEKKGDPDKFFYSIIMINSDSYFSIEKPFSTLIVKRLGDKILAVHHKPAAGPATKPPTITDREMSGLHYICGYVVGNILKKTKIRKDYKSTNSQSVISAKLTQRKWFFS